MLVVGSKAVEAAWADEVACCGHIKLTGSRKPQRTDDSKSANDTSGTSSTALSPEQESCRLGYWCLILVRRGQARNTVKPSGASEVSDRTHVTVYLCVCHYSADLLDCIGCVLLNQSVFKHYHTMLKSAYGQVPQP